MNRDREKNKGKIYVVIAAVAVAAAVITGAMLICSTDKGGYNSVSIYEEVPMAQTLPTDEENRILIEITEKADPADQIANYIDDLMSELIEGKYDRFISELALDKIEEFGYVPLDADCSHYISYIDDVRERMLECDAVYVYQVNKRNNHYTAVVYGIKQKMGALEPVFDYSDRERIGFTVFKDEEGGLTMAPFHIGLLDEYYSSVGFRMSDEYKELRFRYAESEEYEGDTDYISFDGYGEDLEADEEDNPNAKVYTEDELLEIIYGGKE